MWWLLLYCERYGFEEEYLSLLLISRQSKRTNLNKNNFAVLLEDKSKMRFN